MSILLSLAIRQAIESGDLDEAWGLVPDGGGWVRFSNSKPSPALVPACFEPPDADARAFFSDGDFFWFLNDEVRGWVGDSP